MVKYTLIALLAIAVTDITCQNMPPAVISDPTLLDGNSGNWTDPAGLNTAGEVNKKLGPVRIKLDERINKPLDCETACDDEEDCDYWNFYLSKRGRGRKCQLMTMAYVDKKKFYSGSTIYA